MTLARVRPKWAQKAYRSLLPFRIPYPESGCPTPETAEVEGIHGEALRQPPCELLPDAGRG